MVYWLRAGTAKPEIFDPNLKVEAANGIALSSDDKTLCSLLPSPKNGITVVDIASRASHPIGHPPDLCLGTIDGLSWFNGSLIAIQNGVMTPRVVRYRLTPDGKDIAKFEVLERRNPLFDGITTGAMADGAYYFMANTQLDKVAGGRIRRGAQLNPIQILRIDLGP